MPAYDSLWFTPPAPLAIVSLRNGESKSIPDVPMLIDSGADVTLVPRSFVILLGADIDSAGGYELVSFDGARSFAPAAHLDLLFLGRAFKGRFLVIDQPWGILGRDVLNHLALVHDGPRMQWTEHTR